MDVSRADAIARLQDFFREKPLLFIGTGMSCALDPQFGMPALRHALSEALAAADLEDEQRRQWEQVEQSLAAGADLEAALNEVGDVELLQAITRASGGFLAGVDRDSALRIAEGAAQWPAGRLLRRLVDTLPEGDPTLHVVTPNYDLLVEYSCEQLGIAYTCGFTGGIERQRDWPAVERALEVPARSCRGTVVRPVRKLRKHIHLHKVHGSLDYFYRNDSVVQNCSWMWYPPAFAERVMITPGSAKYETLQRYRRELQQFADEAIEHESRFLFLGYGFTDNHLHEYIRRKLVTHNCRGLILTRDSNPRIECLLAEADQLWAVCGLDGDPLAGSRVFNRRWGDWLELPGEQLWDVEQFTAAVLGDV